MCGLFGVVMRAGRPLPGGLLARANSLLRHRGPDEATALSIQRGGGEARVTVGEAEPAGPADLGFAFRRLAIIDLSEGGRQPRRTRDGRFHLMLNGEIYNYRELRAELAEAGWRFDSQSDSEVLLAALAAWGEAALSRLVGMFALALYDRREQRVLLARDFAGIKPLYFLERPECFAFASEPRALLDLPGVERKANRASLAAYLGRGAVDQDDSSFFAGIRRLPPATLLEVDLEAETAGRPRPYWRLPALAPCSPAAAAARLRHAFLDSVRLHLHSDVPVGVALSGGIDSTAVVMAARHLHGRDPPLQGFTYAAGGRFDEENHARLAAKAAGISLARIAIAPGDLARDLPALIGAQGEPFASTSIYAQYRVFQAAREAGVKVMLGGQGADELLAGYAYFVPARLADLLAAGKLAAAGRLLAGAPLPPGGGRPAVLGRALARLLPNFLHRLRRPPRWLAAPWRAPSAARRPFRAELLASFARESLPALLRYEDRNAMAHSIENRVPFLTPAMAEAALSLPDGLLLADDGKTKAVFRQALADLLPAPILARRDKIGFFTPEGTWLAAWDGGADALIEQAGAPARELFDLGALRAAWRRGDDPALWRAVNALAWLAAERIEGFSA